MSFQFSIRYKILTVLSILLSLCVFTYLLLAVRIFKQDKHELVYDLNRSRVSNLSADLNNQFKGIADKLEVYSFLSNENQRKSLDYFVDIMKSSSDIAYVGIYNPNTKKIESEFLDPVFAETYALQIDFFREVLPAQKSVPLDEILKKGEAIWSARIKGGPPLIGYARSIIKEGADRRPVARAAVISYIRADSIMKNLSANSTGRLMIANRTGEILAHSHDNNSASQNQPRTESADQELVQRAIQSSNPTSVLRYVASGVEQLGAYSRTFNQNMIVASRIDGAAAFAVVERLISRSIVFSLIIVTVTFIAAILFSRSITRPLDTLVEGMTKVGHGHLDTQIQVKTRDEISTLAKSFNTMIRDLSQSRAELVKINSELESKVRDRTKKLEEQNQAVKQAQEALLRTTRLAAVGEIAGRAAHEVLNPLTSLMTRVQRVQRRLQEISSSDAAVVAEIVDSWQKDYEAGGYDKLLEVWRTRSEILEGKSIWDEDLKNIAELISKWNQEQNHIVEDTDFLLGEAERISRIVQGMRALSVVKGTKRKYHAHELLNNAKNIMADLFEQSGIEIRLALEAQSDLVDIDKDEFIQSITNIMRNSLQAISGVYESQTGGRLQLRTFDRDGYWYLDVIDNGVGIISSDQKKIFENNFSTKSPEEGTGLGLSISRRFIRAYGGDIAFVSSTPRKETIFRVSLPLHVTSVTEVAV